MLVTNNEPAFVLERSAGFMMGVTSRKISQLFTQRLKPYDITPEQWMVLFCVHERDGMIQTEIAQRTYKDKPTTTRILDVLEAKGLLVKQPSPTDRRSFLVRVTEAGRELVAKTEPIERHCVAEVTSCISADEYDQLIALLHRIGEHTDRLNSQE